MAEGNSPMVGHARLSWVLVCGAVASLGVLGRLPGMAPAPRVLLIGAVMAAAAGLALAVLAWKGQRRHAMLGAGASLLVLLVLGLAALSGASLRRSRAAEEAGVVRASAAAPLEADGWYGATAVGALRLFALEVDRGGALGRMITDNFTRSFIPVVVGADNSAGGTTVVLDLQGTRLVFADGTAGDVLDRGAILAGARQGGAEARRLHGGPYRIAPGQSLGNGLLFLPPEVVLERVAALSLLVDGNRVTVPGRRLTAAEKRAASGRR
jgi:hypothetical protein